MFYGKSSDWLIKCRTLSLCSASHRKDYPLFLFAGEMDIRIANKYRLGRKIGGGSFGDLYLGKKSCSLFLQRKITAV